MALRKIAACRPGVFVALVSAMALVIVVRAQAQAPEPLMAEKVYKNVTVLRGIPAVDVPLSMHVIRAALGVTCDYCHAGADRASDAKKPKVVARQMMTMVSDINKSMFQGRQVVGCYTCHRGNAKPINSPILPYEEPPAEMAGPPIPSVDQILAKYVEALGGEAAIRKITSRVLSTTQDIPTGPGGAVPMPSAAQQFQKAPNMTSTFYTTPTYSIAEGFDGTTKWTQDQTGKVTEAFKMEQMRAARDADFYDVLNVKKKYSQLTVAGVERVDERDTFLVVGVPANDIPEELYFDRDSGLLLRKITSISTPVGLAPYQIDYENYRDAGHGVKIPYVLKVSPGGPRAEMTMNSTVRITKVEENVAIDDAKFKEPASK